MLSGGIEPPSLFNILVLPLPNWEVATMAHDGFMTSFRSPGYGGVQVRSPPHTRVDPKKKKIHTPFLCCQEESNPHASLQFLSHSNWEVATMHGYDGLI
jgi:hypothetical protein